MGFRESEKHTGKQDGKDGLNVFGIGANTQDCNLKAESCRQVTGKLNRLKDTIEGNLDEH